MPEIFYVQFIKMLHVQYFSNPDISRIYETSNYWSSERIDYVLSDIL